MRRWIIRTGSSDKNLSPRFSVVVSILPHAELKGQRANDWGNTETRICTIALEHLYVALYTIIYETFRA